MPFHTRFSIYLISIIAFLCFPIHAIGQTHYEVKGPAGGDVLDIAVSKSDPQKVYAVTDLGQFYWSYDGGHSSWLIPPTGSEPGNFNEEKFHRQARYLSLHPTDPNQIYAGSYFSRYGGFGWRDVSITGVTFNPENPATRLGWSRIDRSGSNILVSYNSGFSWDTLGTFPHNTYSLQVAPSDTSIYYALISDTLYQYTAEQNKWENRGTLPTAESLVGYQLTLAVDPTSAKTLYMSSKTEGLFKSEDSGDNWTQIDSTLAITDIAISPVNSDIIYFASEQGVRKSSDAGESWKNLEISLPSDVKTAVNTIELHPNNESILYVGTDGWGVYKSNDGGDSWQSILLTGSPLLRGNISFDPVNQGKMYLSTPAQGLLVDGYYGENWRSMPVGKEEDRTFSVNNIHFVPDDYPVAYAMSIEKGVYKSTDSLQSWELILEKDMFSAADGLFVQHPRDHDTLYASFSAGYSGSYESYEFYKSTDGGSTWNNIDFVSDSNFVYRATTIRFKPGQPSTIIAGTVENGVFRSQDDGKSWTPINDGLQKNQLNEYDWVNDLEYVIDGQDTLLYIAERNVAVSKDDGDSWTYIDSTLQPYRFRYNDIEINPANPDQIFISASSTIARGGFFVTNDRGENWNRITKVPAHSIALDPFQTNRAYFTTIYGVDSYEGAVTSIEEGEEKEEKPGLVQLENNYPNPFNPTTTIEYALPKTQQVTLEVYDVLGRHIKTLLDGKKSQGMHSVTFNAEGLSSGIYIYRLETAGFVKTRKMTIIK